MKTISKLTLSALALSLVGISSTPAVARSPAFASAQAADGDLKAFPPAQAGQSRHVIRLPAHKDESAVKVELIVGKTMMVDCNKHMFGGNIEERTAQGWGYEYYVLDRLGDAASTLMGCSDRTKRSAFVRSSNEKLVRYNSRLPLVVYAPSDVEVRYRIWRAESQERRTSSARSR